MAANDKDTIYIDIDDEITSIIDKVKNSKGKVVALVLPKRATVFQSIVNMKLLKRAAEASNKHLVLITSEAGLLPLAGAAGIHVAKTLTSKPEIPSGPDMEDEAEDTVQENMEGPEEDVPVDPKQSVGSLAGGGAADGVETVVLDDEDVPPEADDVKPGPKTFAPPKKKNKKLSVPNFERFRLWLILGGLALILLIAAFIFAGTVLPKATISIKTDATSVDVSVPVTLAVAAKSLDADKGTVPAKLAQQQKTYSQQVATTGQKNNGNKASGSVTLTNCSGGDASIPAGTGLSSGGNTYITQDSVTVPDSNYKINGECKKDGKKDVSVLAQNGGTSYNIPSGSNFTVAGKSSVTGTGSSISGGTDSIVKTVNQNDINSAKSKISPNEAEVKQALDAQLKKDNYYPIAATYAAGTPAATNSANVGEVADNVTVTETITYTMFGVHKKDLETLLNNGIKDQIDTAQQAVLNNGLDKANFNVDNISATGGQLTMSATATAGPDLDVASIRKDAAGKKPGAVKDDLGNNPDVVSVDVKLSPFWVSSVPKKTERIKVNIAKPSATAKAGNSSNAGNH